MLNYANLTDIAEKRLRECADEAATMVSEVEFRQRLDMGHGIWQLWLALAGQLDKESARRDMDRLYALIEPESVSGLRSTRPNQQ
ncbi:hypothetical protein [Massilia varians]|uniref:hypothetical protein n=1 Tax=Massilia varians TaxID=457921 RepID=UPI002553EBBD|nr:hypothetical protein [Massilia varians]MDK6080556.1 hypothetical protein [Massilia varians]